MPLGGSNNNPDDITVTWSGLFITSDSTELLHPEAPEEDEPHGRNWSVLKASLPLSAGVCLSDRDNGQTCRFWTVTRVQLSLIPEGPQTPSVFIKSAVFCHIELSKVKDVFHEEVLWFFDSLVLWLFGSLVLWFCGSVVLWFFGSIDVSLLQCEQLVRLTPTKDISFV